MIRCPECGTEVQPSWDWCHACGWDPDGLRATGAAGPSPIPAPASGAAAPPPRPRAAPDAPSPPDQSGPDLRVLIIGAVALGAAVVVIVVAIGFLGSTPAPTAAPPRTTAPTSASTVPPSTAPPPPPPTEPVAWTRWDSPDGTWTVELPHEPAYEEPAVGGFVSRQQQVTSSGPTGEYEVWAYHYSPSGQAALGLGANERWGYSTVDILGIRDPTRSMRTIGDRESIQTDGYVVRDGEKRAASIAVTSNRDRAFVLIAIDGPGGATADLERLIAGFTPT